MWALHVLSSVVEKQRVPQKCMYYYATLNCKYYVTLLFRFSTIGHLLKNLNIKVFEKIIHFHKI